MTAFRNTLDITNPITLFTGFDPYYWATDNIPLQQLHDRDAALADRIDLISVGRVDVTGNGTASPVINALPTGWAVTRNGTGDYTITHSLSTLLYSVMSSCQSTTPAFVNQYAASANTCSIRTYNLSGAVTDMQFSLLITRL
jgi:hypothetical protein